MATMIPKNLDPTTSSNAEKRLFQLFAEGLSNDYTVFHSRWWQHIKYVVQDSEADFIIIHPDKGILILEAKGGKISYDPVDMAWYQNQRKMKVSPFKQAREIKYKFLELLNKHSEFKDKQDFCIGQCVAFPEVDEIRNGLPSEARQEILLLRPQLKTLSNWVSSVFSFYANGRVVKLGPIRTQKIISLIAPSTEFIKYVGNDISDIKKEIYQLTEQQFKLLDYLYHSYKCIILGCAGSGKTQLAIEKSRRLCQHKIRTLVTCKSNNLSLYLAASLQREIQSGYCVVYSYEEIKTKISKVKLELEAIIVDEGQDFAHQEINNLSQLIPSNGTFYVFQDSNQNISKNTNRFALEVNPSVLDKNCRNTDKIFKYAEPFVSCSHPIKSSSIVGGNVIERLYKERHQIFKMLEEDILNLVDSEKVSPEEIIILTDMYPLNKSIFSSYSNINRFPLKQYSFLNRDKGIIQWSNVGMYKGLESDVIFLFFEKAKTLIPNNWDIANRYVGATRARSLLVIYEHPDPEMDF